MLKMLLIHINLCFESTVENKCLVLEIATASQTRSLDPKFKKFTQNSKRI